MRLPDQLPFNLKKYKGSSHWLLNYKAVEFVIQNTGGIPHILEKAMAHYLSTSESYFQILQFNPQVNFPGGMSSGTESGLYEDQLADRHKEWIQNVKKCVSGFVQRGICMLGVKHLPILVSQSFGRKFIANKFPWQFEPIAYDCMQVWHHNKVRREYETGRTAMDIGYFINNSYVKNANTDPGF